MIRRSFAFTAVSAFIVLPRLAHAADSVSGRYAAQHKETKLAFFSARPGSDEGKLVIVATEKDHSASKDPAKDGTFGKFGPAVIISLAKADGKVTEVLLVHPDFPQSPVTVVGSIKGLDVKIAGDRIEGHFTSNGAKTMFEGRPYETVFDVDLKISAQIQPKSA